MDFWKSLVQKVPTTLTQILPSLSCPDFNLTRLEGLPRHVSDPTRIAYDPSQSLLAIGHENGCCSILLKETCVVLDPNDLSKHGDASNNRDVRIGSISRLLFKIGSPYLITLDCNNVLVVWNLSTQKLAFLPVSFNDRVTAIDTCVWTNWIVLGFDNGDVRFVDVMTGACSVTLSGVVGLGTLPKDNQEAAEPTQSKDHVISRVSISALSFHPIEAQKLLIGYQSGLIELWDLDEKRCVKRFLPKLQSPENTVSCLAWHPRAKEDQFVASHADGLLVFWGLKGGLMHSLLKKEEKKTALCVRSVLPADGTLIDDTKPLEQIRSLDWMKNPQGEGSRLVVLGGGSTTSPKSSLTVLDFDSTNNYEKAKPLLSVQVSRQVNSFSLAESRDLQEQTQQILVVLEPHSESKLHLYPIPASTDETKFEVNCTGPAMFELLRMVEPSMSVSQGPEYLIIDMLRSFQHVTDSQKHLQLTLKSSNILNPKRLKEVICILKPQHISKESPLALAQLWQDTTLGPVLLGCFTSQSITYLSPEFGPAKCFLDVPSCHLLIYNTRQVEVWQFIGGDNLPSQRKTKGGDQDASSPIQSSDENTNDIDEMMAQLDATMDQVLGESEAITKMLNDTQPVSPNDLSVDQSKSINAVLLEPLYIPTSTMEHKFLDSFESHSSRESRLPDPHWQPCHRLTFARDISTIAFLPSLSLLVVSTKETVSVIDCATGTELVVLTLSELCTLSKVTTEPTDTISSIALSLGAFNGSYLPCMYITTNQGCILRLFIELVDHGTPRLFTIQKPLITRTQRGSAIISIQSIDSECRIIRVADIANSNRKITGLYHVITSATTLSMVHDSISSVRDDPLHKEITSEDSPLLVTRVIVVKDIPHVMTITKGNLISAYKVSSLDIVWSSSLPAHADLNRIHQLHVNNIDGTISYWTQDGQWESMSFLTDSPLIVPDTKAASVRLYDLYQGKQWMNKYYPNEKLGTTRNTAHDLLLSNSLDPAVGNSKLLTSENAFGHLKNAMDERGERLQELDIKFSRLADASKSFVDQVKELNEKQASKKWWQL